MKWIFWPSVALLGYTLAGYPFLLWLRSRWHPRPVKKGAILPAISVVMAVHNEAGVIAQKLQNLAGVEYPRERMEIIVVSDGSTDGTVEMLQNQKDERLRIIVLSRHEGKAAALNRGVEAARGEVVVFTDARQLIHPQAIMHLVSNFADPSVGCVSGELVLRTASAAEPAKGWRLYWNLEKKIRQWEAAAGSVVGVSGALYAARREMIPALPPWTILDDVYIPLHVARRGARILFEPQALFYDTVASDNREFRRKVRTLTGNYQLLQLAPWLLSRSNPLRFEYVSHKLLRLLLPFALLGTLAGSVGQPGLVYRLALAMQIGFYLLAMVATFRPRPQFLRRLADAARAFVVLNTAAAVALVFFVGGKKQVWVQ